MAKFEIKRAFKISSRPGIILAGNIIEGIINIGDTVLFSYQDEDFEKVILRIEAVDYKIGQPGFYSYVALVVEDHLNEFAPQQIIEQKISISKSK